MSEHAHARALLAATEHVAPYQRIHHEEWKYLDSLHVVRAYRKGEVMLLPKLVLKRLAGRWPTTKRGNRGKAGIGAKCASPRSG